MNEYTAPNTSMTQVYQTESLRLEAVTTCVGFDDILDVTLSENHPQVDHLIVVTSHDDTKTQQVCQKHGATCVQTDLFKKDGRNFNKGAAINAGFNYFKYYGWRVHLDSDIVLPDNFRRVLFNKTHLDQNCLYGASRMDVIGMDNLNAILNGKPSHDTWASNTPSPNIAALSQRSYIDPVAGYVPIGYFQLWHSSMQKPYPYSLGTAAHDDVMFGQLWAAQHRQLLPTFVVYHLCAQQPKWGENWDGNRSQPRIQ